jgi:hypothetical protein
MRVLEGRLQGLDGCPEVPVSGWRFEGFKAAGIRSAQRSGHSTSQCMLPLAALPAIQHKSLELTLVSSLCVRVSGTRGAWPKTPKRW